MFGGRGKGCSLYLLNPWPLGRSLHLFGQNVINHAANPLPSNPSMAKALRSLSLHSLTHSTLSSLHPFRLTHHATQLVPNFPGNVIFAQVLIVQPRQICHSLHPTRHQCLYGLGWKVNIHDSCGLLRLLRPVLLIHHHSLPASPLSAPTQGPWPSTSCPSPRQPPIC